MRGPKVYPVMICNPCHRLIYYHLTDDGLELLTRYNNEEEFLGFFDTEEEVRQAITRFPGRERGNYKPPGHSFRPGQDLTLLVQGMREMVAGQSVSTR